MNLYEIMLQHYAPKDSEKGIFTYLIANSDEEVYEWLKTDPTLKDGRWIVCGYESSEEDEEEFNIYDDDYNVIGEETFKERMIRLKGDMNDEDVELTDLYYGRTIFGWKLVKENITKEQVDVLIDLGISVELISE